MRFPPPPARARRAACALALLAAAGPAGAAELVVVSWGGAYQKSQEEALFRPWMARTGHRVVVEGGYSGGLAEIKAQVETGAVTWDLVSVEAEDAVLGCEEGLLERLDHGALPPSPDGVPAAEDFVDGGLFECGVANNLASIVVAYDRDRLPDGPRTLRDFYDLERFPGKRGLRRTVRGNLEMALLADGVPPARVYEELRAEAGVDRAFAKLDTLRGHAVWWEAGSQPPQLLAAGEVLMTTAFNGRIFDAVATAGRNFAIVWDGQVYTQGYFVIPAGSRRKRLALELIAFATATERLVDQFSRIAYAPARRSAQARIRGYHRDPALDIRPYLTTTPPNLDRAVRADVDFWLDRQTELNERFLAWLSR